VKFTESQVFLAISIITLLSLSACAHKPIKADSSGKAPQQTKEYIQMSLPYTTDYVEPGVNDPDADIDEADAIGDWSLNEYDDYVDIAGDVVHITGHVVDLYDN
jgi:hypothetical protein